MASCLPRHETVTECTALTFLEIPRPVARPQRRDLASGKTRADAHDRVMAAHVVAAHEAPQSRAAQPQRRAPRLPRGERSRAPRGELEEGPKARGFRMMEGKGGRDHLDRRAGEN